MPVSLSPAAAAPIDGAGIDNASLDDGIVFAGQNEPVSTPSTVTAAGRRRGTLQVFLGYAPGVGKTYEMLMQARALHSDGVDVVAAVIEAHGRADTALLAHDIETIAPRRCTYREVTLTDVDTDAVIARNPSVVLVDELAHTNAPGGRHDKRWHDIAEFLDAGIDVLTTVNVQHLQSLNDVVGAITGTRQQETVPDAFVRHADSIELVDITPDALRRRLDAGKVYADNQIAEAQRNYFRPGNLTALRELALLWLADRVDESLADYRSAHGITDTWEARERVVVAITGGAESATLLRRASRIASRASAELIAVHVVRGDGLLDRLSGEMPSLTSLADDVGAQMHTIAGDSVVNTLLDFASDVNATQVVLGTSRRSRWQRVVTEGTAAQVIRRSGSIDIHMVTHGHTSHRNVFDIRGTAFHRPLSWVAAIAVPALATAVMLTLTRWTGLGTQTAVFFVVVLAVSLLGGVGPAVVSALVSGLLLNFFFTQPVHSFTIAEPENLSTIIVMLVIAIAVALLVNAASRRRREAAQSATEAELLTTFATAVLNDERPETLLSMLAATFDQRAVTMGDIESGVTTIAASVGDDPPTDIDHADTAYAVPDSEYTLMMRGRALSPRERRVVVAVAHQAAGVIERRRLSQDAAAKDAALAADRLRRALLSAVGHDLRTPLAAVKAAASSLRSSDVSFSVSDTAELHATIEESADHLSSIVENLLDSSRLAAGAITPQMRVASLSEVTGQVVIGLAAYRPSDIDRITIADAAPTVYADPVLLERVLANLIDNALKHGGNTGINIVATDDGRQIRVIDHGGGIHVDDPSTVFSAFHRRGDQNASSGVGLGLSVAQGFTEAMGGSIEIHTTPGGGATMVVNLPPAPAELGPGRALREGRAY